MEPIIGIESEPEGDASEAADVGTCRLIAGPSRGTVTTIREDGVAALEALAYRPQPRARPVRAFE